LMFFFSSRRRHTRSKRDWSSDVCSSDLVQYDGNRGRREAAGLRYVSHGDHFDFSAHSDGTSNESCSRNPRVFHTPKAIPASIQIEPTILAGWLRFHHNPRQMKKPADGETKFITFFCSALTK